MSYILDALKKSDQERQQENGPSLHSVHGYPPAFQSSPSFRQRNKTWLSVLATILTFTCLGTSFYWYQFKYSPGKHLQPAINSQQAENLPSPASPLAEIEAAETLKDYPVSPLVLYTDKKKILRTTVSNYANTPPSAPPNTVIQTKTFPSVKDLPPEIHQNIPELILAGHTYSDEPDQRMIIINNKILREGGKINMNIRLVEITWDGVILDYKGTKFQQTTD